MRTTSIPDAEIIAAKLASEEVDGKRLLGLQSKHEVKEALKLPFGKATKVWLAVQKLKGSETPPAPHPGAGLMLKFSSPAHTIPSPAASPGSPAVSLRSPTASPRSPAASPNKGGSRGGHLPSGTISPNHSAEKHPGDDKLCEVSEAAP